MHDICKSRAMSFKRINYDILLKFYIVFKHAISYNIYITCTWHFPLFTFLSRENPLVCLAFNHVEETLSLKFDISYVAYMTVLHNLIILKHEIRIFDHTHISQCNTTLIRVMIAGKLTKTLIELTTLVITLQMYIQQEHKPNHQNGSHNLNNIVHQANGMAHTMSRKAP